jgi:hypothetical protein
MPGADLEIPSFGMRRDIVPYAKREYYLPRRAAYIR